MSSPSYSNASIIINSGRVFVPDKLKKSADMSGFSYNINNTPGENIKALQEKIWAENEYNNQLSRQFSKSTQRKYNNFTAQYHQLELHSAKLEDIISRHHDSETSVALRLAIVITNSRNRLLDLKAKEEGARRVFDMKQEKFQQSQKIYRQELQYLVRNLEPCVPLVDQGQITKRPRLRFMSFGYFASAFGITRAR